MRRTLRLLPLIGLTLALPAAAQGDLPAESPIIQYKAVTEIDIEGVSVEGTIDGPSIALLAETNRKGFAPMIHLRLDFNVEMVESVDLLR